RQVGQIGRSRSRKGSIRLNRNQRTAPSETLSPFLRKVSRRAGPSTERIAAMAKLDQDTLTQIVQAVLASLGQTAAPTAASHFLPKGSKAAPSGLASKDARIAAAFARRGFKVTLKDRANPDAPFDVKPFKAWLSESRIVRKGQRGVAGLFHLSQTDLIAKP